MNKKELRALRTLKATKEMMEKAREVKAADRYAYERYETSIFLRAQHLNGYLKIAVFDTKWMKKNVNTPVYEIFINVSGDGDYITRQLDTNYKELRWSKAKLENLPVVTLNGKKEDYTHIAGWYSADRWMDKNQAQYIKKTLKTNHSGYEAIREYQNRISREKILAQRKKETDPWDADMALVPAEPKGFRTWADKNVLEHFIFYHYDKKRIEQGYCSCCKQYVKLTEKPTHNKKSTCPKCKHPITYKSDGKVKRLTTKEGHAVVIQNIKDGIVIRHFELNRTYNAAWCSTATILTPKISVSESERTLIRGDKWNRYYYTVYKNDTVRWCESYIYSYMWTSAAKVYPNNLRYVDFGNSVVQEAIKRNDKINVERWMRNENLTVEQCMKIGLYRIANSIVDGGYNNMIDDRYTELTKALQIDKARLKRLLAVDLTEYLIWLQDEKKDNTIYPDEVMIDMAKHKISKGDLTTASMLTNMSVVKAYNYLVKQTAADSTIKHTLSTYADYMNMAKRAGYNTDAEQIYKPKDLKAAHSDVIDLLQKDGWKKQAKTTRKKFPKVNKVCKTLKKYEYEDSKYKIVAPTGIEDIIREGTLLHHCIHTCDFYYDRIQTKESFLMFLRKQSDPKKPWYTLEVEPNGNIRQKRTTGDNQGPDLTAAVPFLKKWQKWLQKILSDEDKKLAKESEKKRKENYKKIREEHKTVWHGKCAGKLLADVLEADFLGLEEDITNESA